jgi:hypothetical protein
MRTLRLLSIGLVVFFTGCATVDDLTRLSCTPSTAPGEVTLQRVAYLYRIDGEPNLSLWDSPLRSGEWNAGQLTLKEPTPIYTLAPGTSMVIAKVSRTRGTGAVPSTIQVDGEARIENALVAFHYAWGENEHVNHAPWEASADNPHEFNRVVTCKRTN